MFKSEPKRKLQVELTQIENRKKLFGLDMLRPIIFSNVWFSLRFGLNVFTKNCVWFRFGSQCTSFSH